MYTYKDFITGKTKRTRGKFVGWTGPTGILNVPYAIFRNRRGDVLVPRYLVTKETLIRIGKPPGEVLDVPS